MSHSLLQAYVIALFWRTALRNSLCTVHQCQLYSNSGEVVFQIYYVSVMLRIWR